MQCRGQIAPQPFARHFQNIVDARIARRRFQEHAGPAVQVKDVPLAIHECAGRGDLLQQRLFGQFTQGQLRNVGYFSDSQRQGGIPACEGWQVRQKATQCCALRALNILFALVGLGLAVQHGEQITKLPHGFRCAQKKHTARHQGVVKQGNQLLLQVCAHVNQQVAATDQVEFGKRWVLDQVMLGKNQHVANVFAHAVSTAVGLGGEKTRQSPGRNVGGNTGWINTGSGRGNGTAVNVGAEDLHFVALPE